MKLVKKLLKRLIEYVLIFIGGLLTTFVLLVLTAIVNTLWNPGEFRFEHFKTGTEFKNCLESRFHKGEASQPLIALLESAGAKSRIIPKEHYDKEDREINPHLLYGFHYSTGWLYLPTLTKYGLYLWVDKDLNIIKFSVGVQYGG